MGCTYIAGAKSEIDFLSMSNLFHPSTIDGCFVHSGAGRAGGFKVMDEQLGKMVWNVHPHKDRIIRITERELRVMAETFEDGAEPKTAKLVSVHSKQILSVLEKLAEFEGKVGDVEFEVSEGWHETSAVDKGIIRRETTTPNPDAYELIYSGPHFFRGQSLLQDATLSVHIELSLRHPRPAHLASGLCASNQLCSGRRLGYLPFPDFRS